MGSGPLILGIETSCDETAGAVVSGGREILSSVVASQETVHAEFGGVVPELAARAHSERILPVIRAALDRAGVTLTDLDAIGVSHRPGLIGCLLVGIAAAKGLAWSLGKPLVGVDHVHAHLIAGLLHRRGTPAPAESGLLPALGLVVSGGHTSMYALRSWTEPSRLGGTIDDAAGEAFDKVGAILGLPFPGGPEVDRLARSAGADDRAFDFPVSRLAGDSLDVSFSGLKTAVLYAVRGVPARPGRDEPAPVPPLDARRRADIGASFERAAVRTITLKVERALDRLGPENARSIITGGGVSANTRFREELRALAERRALRLVLPPPSLSIDNGAMIAALACERLRAGLADDLSLEAVPTTAC